MQNLWQVYYPILWIILLKEFRLNVKTAIVLLNIESVKGNLIKYKCLSSSKDYSNKIDKEFKKRVRNIFKFPNNDINKFILLLWKVFVHRNTWMVGTNSVKHHCLRKKILHPLRHGRYYWCILHDINNKEITHRANICSWNIRGIFSWYIPRIFRKSSLWNSAEYSQIMFREYWI